MPGKAKGRVEKAVKLLKQLQNPYALVLQGFLVGGLLFWTTQGDAAPQPVVHAASIIAAN